MSSQARSAPAQITGCEHSSRSHNDIPGPENRALRIADCSGDSPPILRGSFYFPLAASSSTRPT